MKRKSKTILAATLGVAVVAVGGASYALGAPVAPATGRDVKDVVVRTAAATTESQAGGAWTTVASVTLPAGAWVVSYHATVVNFGASDYARCSAFKDGTDLGGSASLVGDPSKPGAQGPGALLATVSNASGLKLRTPSTLSLRCEHDHTRASGSPYVDAGASLVAHKGTVLSTFVQ